MIDFRSGPWAEALVGVDMVDLLCADTPYSARTHKGHDAADGVANIHALGYSAWSAEHVCAFCDYWCPRTRGWVVTITDHVLAPVWASEMERHGRYVFAPLPWFAPGSRVRLAGDGPSSWTCWIIVGRPRTGEYRDGTPAHKWGTLPGGYAIAQDRGSPVVGSKPLALMRALVRDYSRPGDLVCDPCAGGATTLLAAAWEGRRAVGAEVSPDTFALASARIASEAPSRERWAAIEAEARWKHERSVAAKSAAREARKGREYAKQSTIFD